jgi:hypothetical protein
MDEWMDERKQKKDRTKSIQQGGECITRYSERDSCYAQRKKKRRKMKERGGERGTKLTG